MLYAMRGSDCTIERVLERDVHGGESSRSTVTEESAGQTRPGTRPRPEDYVSAYGFPVPGKIMRCFFRFTLAGLLSP